MKTFSFPIRNNIEIESASIIQRTADKYLSVPIRFIGPYHLIQYFVTTDRNVTQDGESYHLSQGYVVFSSKNEPNKTSPVLGDTIVYNIFFNTYTPSVGQQHPALDLELPFVFDAKELPYMEDEFKQIADLFNQKTPTSQYKAELMLRQLLIDLHEAYHKPEHHDQIEMSLNYIHDHTDQTITVQDLLDITNLPRSTFDRQFKKQTGKSANQYIQDYKIAAACQILLLAPETKIFQLAESLGYCDAFHFSNTFKKVTGLSPKNYKEKLTPKN